MTKNSINLCFICLLGVSAYSLQLLHRSEYIHLLLAGIGPLTIYFLILLLNVKSITRIQLDNTYYFGFLITIISLAISAYHFEIKENNIDISLITKQFSIGLVATGLALAYKLFLLDIWNDPDEVGFIAHQKEELSQYTLQARKMFNELESTTKALVGLANSSVVGLEALQNQTNANLNETHEKSLKIISATLQEAMEDNFKSLKNSCAEAAGIVSSFSSSINEVSKNSDFKKFSTSFELLASYIENLSGTFEKSNSDIENSSRKFTANFEILGKSVENLSSTFQNGIPGIETSSGKISNTFEILGKSIENLSSTIEKSIPDIENSSSKVSSHQDSLESLSQVSIRVAQSLLLYHKKLDLDQSVKSMNKLSDSIDGLVNEMNSRLKVENIK